MKVKDLIEKREAEFNRYRDYIYASVRTADSDNFLPWEEWQRNFCYARKCPNCGQLHIVKAQEDKNPKAYVTISIMCTCRYFVEFDLPVKI